MVLDEFRYALSVCVKAMTGLIRLLAYMRAVIMMRGQSAECNQLDESV
jgi:hypothetical protein